MSMIFFILAILAALAGVIVLVLFKSKTGIIPIIVGVLLLIVSCFAIVPTGYTGILTTFGAVEERTLNNGPNFIAPWQSVVNMDNHVQEVTLNISAFSSDMQEVEVSLSMNFQVDAITSRELYRTVGRDYYNSIMSNRVEENTKIIFAMYTAEGLITSREVLGSQIKELMQADMDSYGVHINTISVKNIDFTDAFTAAVEAKQVATQNKLTAETIQAQQTMEEEEAAKRAIIVANAEAEKAIIAAQADLEVVQIQAEASLYAGQREAEMNQRIAEALTSNLIAYYWIKQWDGKLPSTVLDSDGNYMINLP